MKSILKNKKILAWAAVLLIFVAACLGAYGFWRYSQPKFRDVTVELGTESVRIDQFLTEYANPSRVSLVSDVSRFNLNEAGETEITLMHGNKQETVVLHVIDTTNPEVAFVTDMLVPVDYTFKPEDFVTGVADYSETTIRFLGSAAVPVDYSDITVTVEITDASGNTVRQDCNVSFFWLRDSVTLEYGEKLEPADLLILPQRDSELLSQQDLDLINGSVPGEYVISSSNGFKTLSCTVTVQDTRGPEIVVQNLNCYPWEHRDLEDFISSVTDASGDVQLRLMSELNFDTLGVQTVLIEAEDIYGNITQAEAYLSISEDHYAPSLFGLEDLTVEKHSTPDYLSGVEVYDNIDTDCEIVVDASGVDVDTAGTYYAVYTVTDSSLNTTTVKRKIIVNHDEEDVKLLVESIAAELSDDPEELRDYVRGIIYSSSWGGDDPVWFGFTKWAGNCYVHAVCLKALFDAKGIESQVIWVTDKTHYWLVVKIGDVWRHIDPTPSSEHMRYSLMTDELRRYTLGGREWDRDAWPACE